MGTMQTYVPELATFVKSTVSHWRELRMSVVLRSEMQFDPNTCDQMTNFYVDPVNQKLAFIGLELCQFRNTWKAKAMWDFFKLRNSTLVSPLTTITPPQAFLERLSRKKKREEIV
jgi:hypothetical protein